MIRTISKRQEQYLNAYLNSKKEKDEEEMTEQDQILEQFLPVRKGIRKNGFNIPELLDARGLSNIDYKGYTRFQTAVCNLQTSLVEDGIPFGSLKPLDGGLKKYGFPDGKEWDEVQFSRKKRLVSEIRAGLHYLDEEDKLTEVGKKFLIEFDKQLKLFK